MRLVDVADAEQGVRDGDLGPLGDLEQEVDRTADLDAVPGQDERTLGGGDHLGQVVGLGHVTAVRAQQPGQAQLVRLGVGRIGLDLEDVLGEVQEHRPGPPAARDLECLGDRERHLVRIHDHRGVLRHRLRDADDVGLLEGVLAEERARHVAGDRDQRDAVHHGRREADDQVDRPRADWWPSPRRRRAWRG